ncbi:MEKHLA domain-containing protein [Vibrio atlanticus]|nr:MEKHLA domain-containing protein [Vibrio atlanticus]
MSPMQSLSKLDYVKQVKIISHNYNRIFGKQLYRENNSDLEIFYEVWNSHFAIVSHGTEINPLFNFANKKALEIFELNYLDFIGLPSIQTADALAAEDRIMLLNDVNRHGFVKNYSGIRVSAKGKKFQICDAVIFNLFDFEYNYHGQAAIIPSVKDI